MDNVIEKLEKMCQRMENVLKDKQELLDSGFINENWEIQKPYQPEPVITQTEDTAEKFITRPKHSYKLENFEAEKATFDLLEAHYTHTPASKSGSYDVPNDSQEIDIYAVYWEGVNILQGLTAEDKAVIEAEILEDILEKI